MDAREDMLRASHTYYDLARLVDGHIAFLGGAFLSWSGHQVAEDWDIYVPLDYRAKLENLGFVFSTRVQSYSHRSNWLISTNHVTPWRQEQVILVDPVIWPVWSTFDYVHCMLGIVGWHETVNVGAIAAAGKRIVKNPLSPHHRKETSVLTKLAGKVVTQSRNDTDVMLNTIGIHETIEKFRGMLKPKGLPSPVFTVDDFNDHDHVLPDGPPDGRHLVPVPPPRAAGPVTYVGPCYLCGARAQLVRTDAGPGVCDDCR